MVSFICNACGQTVRKNQVEKHYQNVCHQCDALSCIDCGKDFHGEEYVAHTSCITEAEKYQGKLFQPKGKSNKGEQKQQEWIQQLKQVSGTADPSIKNHVQRLKQYSNIPRKKAKFQKFCKNSVNIYDQPTLDKLWDAFFAGDKAKTPNEKSPDVDEQKLENNEETISAANKEESSDTEKKIKGKKGKKEKKKKDKEGKTSMNKTDDHEIEQNGLTKKNKRKRKHDKIEDEGEPSGKMKITEENNNTEETVEDTIVQGKFNWGAVIKKALKETEDNELPVKRLRKKVLAEFKARGDKKPHTDNELRALFERKLNKNPKIKVKKDIAKLCKK